MGCAPKTWVKPTSQPAEFDQAKTQCTEQATQRYCQIYFCYSRYEESEEVFSRVNKKLFTDCMNAKGWYLQQTDISP
jgi:hypothetical protein